MRASRTVNCWNYSCVATTDNQAEFSAGVVRAANSLRMVATLTVDKYGPTVRKIIRQLNSIYSTTHRHFQHEWLGTLRAVSLGAGGEGCGGVVGALVNWAKAEEFTVATQENESLVELFSVNNHKIMV